MENNQTEFRTPLAPGFLKFGCNDSELERTDEARSPINGRGENEADRYRQAHMLA